MIKLSFSFQEGQPLSLDELLDNLSCAGAANISGNNLRELNQHISSNSSAAEDESSLDADEQILHMLTQQIEEEL